MKKKLVALSILILALFVVVGFTSMSFAALTVSSMEINKLKVTTPATINSFIDDQAIITDLVIKGNGPDAVLLEKQTLFKRKNTGQPTTDQPVLMIISKKARVLTDDSGNMVIRPNNDFTFTSMGLYYYLVNPADQHLAMKQEVSMISGAGNQMKKPTVMDNGLFL